MCIRSLDVHLAELLATKCSSRENGEESVFDIAMAPILAFDLGSRADIASTKRVGRACVEDEEEGKHRQPAAAKLECHIGVVGRLLLYGKAAPQTQCFRIAGDRVKRRRRGKERKKFGKLKAREA